MNSNYLVKHDDYCLCLDFNEGNIIYNTCPKVRYGDYGIIEDNNLFYLLTEDDDLWSPRLKLSNLERAALALGFIELKRNLKCQNPETKKRFRNYKFVGEIPRIKSKQFGLGFVFAKRRVLCVKVSVGDQELVVFPDDVEGVINCLSLKGLSEK